MEVSFGCTCKNKNKKNWAVRLSNIKGRIYLVGIDEAILIEAERIKYERKLIINGLKKAKKEK